MVYAFIGESKLIAIKNQCLRRVLGRMVVSARPIMGRNVNALFNQSGGARRDGGHRFECHAHQLHFEPERASNQRTFLSIYLKQLAPQANLILRNQLRYT